MQIRVAYLGHGKYNEALADFNQALQINPGLTAAYFTRGLAYSDLGKPDLAVTDFDHAILMDPKAAPYYVARGEAYGQKNQLNLAITDFNQAITLDPTNASVFADRALAQAKLGSYGDAIADCESAIKLKADLGEAYNNLAWILATCPEAKYRDAKKALYAATVACNLGSWKVPTSVDTFAAACAEAGDFANAVKWEQIAIGQPGMSPGDIADAKKRLALYQAHKTYQEPPDQSPAPFTN